MTDQPKPNQPPATPNTEETKQPPKEVLPPTQAKPNDSDTVPAKPHELTRPVEPPKPLGDAKPIITETKPQAAPTQPNSNTSPAPSAPTQQTAPKPTDAPVAPASAPTSPERSAPPSEPMPPNIVQPIPANATIPPANQNPTVPAASAPPAPRTPDKEDTIPPSSNGSKVTQRFGDPSPAGQPNAGTICPNCGHRNRPGTLICDNCGTSLISGTKAAIGTRDLVSATEAAATTSEPLLDAAQLNAVESAGGSAFSDDMVLRIEIEGGATPMLVYPKQEIILGRRDPNTGTLPDVDMTAYSGYRMGVSRTHASIRLQDKLLNLSDRGSSNGTFLNGTRLVAHRPYPIKDGDEIRLGQMVLKIYFQSNKNRK